VQVSTGDFFTVAPEPRFDVVIGNPPFVRYQDFAGEARSRSRAAALQAGVNLTRLASSWAAFTVHSALFLKPGGRLALVLPAELLSVNYAAEVRRFLLRRFGQVRLVLFTERIFPGVQAEVLLLLAEGSGGTDHCQVQQLETVRDLRETLAPSDPRLSTWRPGQDERTWTSVLLPGPARGLLAELAERVGLGLLGDWGRTTLGAVTGNNAYFTRSPEQVHSAGFEPERDLVPLSPPGSRHLRGLGFDREAWLALGAAGGANWLFRPAGDPSPAGAAYIEAGERSGVPAAYKCRVRSPWWRVPLAPPADLLLTYMNADTARLIGNQASVYHLNSVHGVRLRPGLRRLGTETLPLAALNSLTLLGAEAVGRSYGGGLLKLEPAEAERLPVPEPELVGRLAPALAELRARVSAELASGRVAGELPGAGLLRAVKLVNSVLLVEGLGLTRAEVDLLASARQHLAGRRQARSATSL
jgi:hypothetical protein